MTKPQHVRFNLTMWRKAGWPRIKLHLLGQLYLTLAPKGKR